MTLLILFWIHPHNLPSFFQGVLLNQCRTLDQAKALLEFIDAITDKKLDRTVSLTAARGRGKYEKLLTEAGLGPSVETRAPPPSP